eukprot:scaffold34797_cov19-Tisochrysis_lutea.AAC.1
MIWNPGKSRSPRAHAGRHIAPKAAAVGFRHWGPLPRSPRLGTLMQGQCAETRSDGSPTHAAIKDVETLSAEAQMQKLRCRSQGAKVKKPRRRSKGAEAKMQKPRCQG